MGTSVIPNKLKEELEDVKKVYDYGKTICTHPNSFDRLQTEIVKVCNVNKELEKENKRLGEQVCNVANNLLDNWCRNEEDYCPHLDKLEKENAELKNQNNILSKALDLYVNWADECGIAWDNFPDMEEKWYKIVEEKGLGWIDGLVFMVMQEAKEQLEKEQK